MTEADATPAGWTQDAARLPLAFAQVREDPRLDLELAEGLPSGSTMVMIASGGETAACLAFTRVRRLYLVDLNPAQLALTRLKLRLSGASPASRTCACWATCLFLQRSVSGDSWFNSTRSAWIRTCSVR